MCLKFYGFSSPLSCKFFQVSNLLILINFNDVTSFHTKLNFGIIESSVSLSWGNIQISNRCLKIFYFSFYSFINWYLCRNVIIDKNISDDFVKPNFLWLFTLYKIIVSLYQRDIKLIFLKGSVFWVTPNFLRDKISFLIMRNIYFFRIWDIKDKLKNKKK